MRYIFTSVAVRGINQSIRDRSTLFPTRVRVWAPFLLTLEYEVCLYLSYSTGDQAMNKSMFYYTSPTCPRPPTVGASRFIITSTCIQTIVVGTYQPFSPSHLPVHRLSLVIALPSHLPVPQTTAAPCFAISATYQCKTNRFDCFTTSSTCPQAIAAD